MIMFEARGPMESLHRAYSHEDVKSWTAKLSNNHLLLPNNEESEQKPALHSMYHEVQADDAACRMTIALPTPPRRVRFEVDSENRIAAKIYQYERPEDYESERVSPSDLYWTPQEQFESRRRAYNKGQLIRKKYPAEVEALEQLFNSCRLCDVTGNTDDDCEGTLDKQDFLLIHMWACSHGRGFEGSISPLIRDERRMAVGTILAHQAFLRQERVDASVTQESLRRHSLTISRRSREFAIRMALGDALAAYNL